MRALGPQMIESVENNAVKSWVGETWRNNTSVRLIQEKPLHLTKENMLCKVGRQRTALRQCRK